MPPESDGDDPDAGKQIRGSTQKASPTQPPAVDPVEVGTPTIERFDERNFESAIEPCGCSGYGP